jgi:riboflavin synthase
MFSGIIESLGTVIRLDPEPPGVRLVVEAGPLSEGMVLGASVSVNGCCLTVVGSEQGELSFDAGAETLDRTNLGQLQPSDQVNLERSLKIGDPLGGHFVTGHIDATGVLQRREDEGDWSTLWFSVPSQSLRQMASKGSVAVDGISLTLVEVTEETFSVALIPHTLEVTTLGTRQPGETVNVETDVLAKYVEQQLSGPVVHPNQ